MSQNVVAISEESVRSIAADLEIPLGPVTATLELLLSDCTVPFIARYRKEATGGLDEVQIRDIRDKYDYILALEERKIAILKSIEEQGKLTPELRSKIAVCREKSELEDLYLPFKPKRRTRGQMAKERGLDPLAEAIWGQSAEFSSFAAMAESLVGSHADLKKLDDVLAGVRDIIAERISETPEVRRALRQFTFDHGTFVSVVRDEHKEKKTKYTDYYDFKEPVNAIAAHRLMALRRGEKEEILRVTLEVDTDEAQSLIAAQVIRSATSTEIKTFLLDSVRDSYNRLLAPGIETELRLETKNRAEEDAIVVFSKNLRSLLLLSPIPKRVVLGVDPGFRTGSKLVVVDGTGKLLEWATIYPNHDHPVESEKNGSAREKLLDLARRYAVEYVSIGNGTAGREMEQFVEDCLKADKSVRARVVMVNESGASVYSASDVAREEFPDLDITYRGAVSIARRLQDPLAELVKIDPKSIGVGQYQHDVNQTKLKKSLEEVVESCVNYVGVNLNTASASLLSYVSGIGAALAKSIVAARNEQGEFRSRADLLRIPGFGPKTFQQAAGFLRIPDSANPLDNSAVHPEAYPVVEEMAKSLQKELAQLVGDMSAIERLNLAQFVTQDIGMLTLKDILSELKKPGRDPREDGSRHRYSREVRAFEELKEGQLLTGTVTNVTNFGAFVDIGVHQDGLIHVSELSCTFIKNVADHIKVGDEVRVKVIGVDKERKRISLSKKALELGESGGSQGQQRPPQSRSEPRDSQTRNATPSRSENRSQRPQSSSSSRHARPKEEDKGPASLNDLLSKFNANRI
jgi:uncharacterized protein